jgi:hypothetical protein
MSIGPVDWWWIWATIDYLHTQLAEELANINLPWDTGSKCEVLLTIYHDIAMASDHVELKTK